MALPIVAIDLFGQPFSHVHVYINGDWTIAYWLYKQKFESLTALKIIDYSRFFVLGLLLTEYEVRRLFLMSVISRD